MNKKPIIAIKVDPGLKIDFEWACALKHTTASAVLRQYMREFIAEHHDKALESVVLSDSSDSRPDSSYPSYYPKDVLHETHLHEICEKKRLQWLVNQFESRHPEEKIMIAGADREELKRGGEGYDLVEDMSKSLEERAKGLLNVIRAYFSRSVLSSLDTHDPYSYRRHPGFDEFAAHFLASQGNLEHLTPDRKEVIALLRQRYPLTEPVRITPGSSYWDQ